MASGCKCDRPFPAFPDIWPGDLFISPRPSLLHSPTSTSTSHSHPSLTLFFFGLLPLCRGDFPFILSLSCMLHHRLSFAFLPSLSLSASLLSSLVPRCTRIAPPSLTCISPPLRLATFPHILIIHCTLLVSYIISCTRIPPSKLSLSSSPFRRPKSLHLHSTPTYCIQYYPQTLNCTLHRWKSRSTSRTVSKGSSH